jgi:murein DD-endopeptidase MepM/ murein hydrolase activator NlpD
VDWNQKQGVTAKAGEIFRKLCELKQYEEKLTLLITTIWGTNFRPSIFTQDPDRYPQSSSAMLLEKLWDQVAVTESEVSKAKRVNAQELEKEIAERPALPEAKPGVGQQAVKTESAKPVVAKTEIAKPSVQVAKEQTATKQTQQSDFFGDAGRRIRAWYETSLKGSVEGKKVDQPGSEVKKPVPKVESSKVEPPKVASPTEEKKISVPKSVGKDAWSDKPWHMPLDVMEMRRRKPRQKEDQHLMKSAFGFYRTQEGSGLPKEHGGIDFAAEPGSPVYNVFDGQFLYITTQKDVYGKIIGFGHYIVVLHQTKDLPSQQRKYLEARKIQCFRTLYAHLKFSTIHEKSPELKAGCFIKAGQLMALSGASGNADKMTDILNGAHLHFEARIGEKGKEVFDPLPLFKPALIKDACRIYINKHLENPQKHKPFVCDKKGCSGCSHVFLKELKQFEKPIYSINDALYL